MAKGFDLEAFRASQQDQDAQETFDVHLGESKDDEGNTTRDVIHIPPVKSWPLEAQARFADGDVVEGMRLLAGEEGARLFAEYEWTFGEFEALFEALAKWSGFNQGRTSAQRRAPGSTRSQN